MDFFSGFTARSGEKTIAKQIARLTSPNYQHEDRLRAAEILAELDTDEAILGMLRRYDMTLEKSYMDQDEKLYVRDLLVRKGERVIAPIRQFFLQSDSVSWPERILSNILEDDGQVVETLLEIVEEQKDSGDMKGQKRAKLLSLLIKYQDPRIPPRVLPFLKDFDESARFTAVEVLDAQGDSSVAETLLAVMVGPDEESQRVRHRIMEAFLHHGWSVAKARAEVAAWLPAGYVVRGDKVVEA